MFCRECGKEIEQDWVSCPFCASPQGRHESKSSKSMKNEDYVSKDELAKILATVMIIGIAAAIILYPWGTFGISLFDQMTMDCSVWSGFDQYLDEDESIVGACSDVQFEALMGVGVTLIVAVSLLAVILMSDNHGSKKKVKYRYRKKSHRQDLNSAKSISKERKMSYDKSNRYRIKLDKEESVQHTKKGNGGPDQQARHNNQVGTALGIPAENWSGMSPEQKDDFIEAEEVEIKCPSCDGRCFVPNGYSGEICCWKCKHVWSSE